jgi:iron(III) transport system substrate-binding protein
LVVFAVLTLVVAACGGQPVASPATTAPTVAATASAAPGELDAATVASAKREGKLVLYTSLNEDDAKYVVGKFQAKYPEIKVTLNRKSSEKIVAQAITEMKAGQVLVDVIETGGLDLAKVIKEGFIAEFRPPAATTFAENLRDARGLWTAARIGIETIAWNTTKVTAANAPKSFDDLADPKWKGKILLESTDVEVMMGLAKRKFGGDDAKVRDYFTKLAANQPQLSAGHTETLDLLIAGQRDVFWGAHAHTTLQKQAAGAPVDYMRTEAVFTVDGVSLVKGSPSQNAAKLFINWYVGDEGQKSIADRKRVPARASAADPKLLPATTYVTGPDLIDDFTKYQKLWDEFFKT